MRLLEAGRRLAGGCVNDVVSIARRHACRDVVESGRVAHAVSDGMVGAGRVAADPQPADDLAARSVEGDAAAEGDDPAGVPDRRWRLTKLRIEGIRIVEPVERPAGLGRRIEIGGRQRQRGIAEIVRRFRLGDGDLTAARPRVSIRLVGVDDGTQIALAVDDCGPHPVGLENAAICVGLLRDRNQLLLDRQDERGAQVTPPGNIRICHCAGRNEKRCHEAKRRGPEHDLSSQCS